MAFRRLQSRFVLAGALLVLTTVACGAWGVAALLHMRFVANAALRSGVGPAAATSSTGPALDLLHRETVRDVAVILCLCALSVVLLALIAIYLARRVIVPIGVLTQFADSIRFGDFSRRVEVSSSDELGRLAAGLNRMAAALRELQQFNLAQLLESKWTLEATLEALPDAVMVIDAAGQVVSMNRTARAVFGGNGDAHTIPLGDLQLPEAVSNAIGEALRGIHPPMPRADLKAVIAASAEGQPVKLLPLVVPVPGFQSESHGAVLALYDVTEFAKLDELRMELISVASHELKNPLTTLQMNVLMLRDSGAGLSERQRQMLDNAVEGCAELGRTIEELLDLTRADAGTLQLSVDQIDLGVMLDHAIRPFRDRFADAGVELLVEKQDARAVCRADAARLNMVMGNLLANALKYTPHGGRATVRLSSMQNAGVQYGPTLKIAVTDTGPGIPAEFRDRVFEKFFRVEHHRKGEGRELRGTGIGLYLCKHIIEAHGGNIWAEPGEDGTGTTVALTLPGEKKQ